MSQHTEAGRRALERAGQPTVLLPEWIMDCDWGGCQGMPFALRWDGSQYLAVCDAHDGPPVAVEGDLAIAPAPTDPHPDCQAKHWVPLDESKDKGWPIEPGDYPAPADPQDGAE